MARRILPALALRDGVPSHLRTLVAVPTLLTTHEFIEEQIERLEIHYLASPEGNLHFALLSDWVDAMTEHLEDDAALLAAAAEGIARLNQRHGAVPGGDRFLLLHRRRVWNEGEGRWIGWERKRGKLHELNRLLRGATDTTFVSTAQQTCVVPADVRYVITLDADTRLPRDTVRRLIGKMAHPLNRPRFDADAGRVVEGYAVLQPRVTPSLPIGREGSLFQRVFSGMSGIDPYAAAVSDVYQDMFGEGSYAGKGIYEVDPFEAAVAGRVLDSTLLSHDLFEGVFARAGLASDVEVVDEFPARYDVAALRHHRWARGDWQLLPWILGRGPVASEDRKRGAIPAIGRWKMVDNLRRTLSAPAAVLALLVGWTLPFEAAAIWTFFVLATIILPTLIPVVAAVIPGRTGITVRSHLGALSADLRLALAQSGAHDQLPCASGVADGRRDRTNPDPAVRYQAASARVGSGRAGSDRSEARPFRLLSPDGRSDRHRRCGGARRFVGGHGTWPLALPFAALWIASPAIARWTSRSPVVAGELSMSHGDAQALRLIARRTWRFFETFVTPADQMLPPDNFQEDPAPALAHRTSPTNLGLYLLSVVSARDLGWTGTIEAVERLETTLSTMNRLARFRGHFYNWYDTRDLRPLDPQYISSVDSGNLAGHLIALANTCREWTGQPLTDERRLAGIADALELMREEASRLRENQRTQTVTWRQLDEAFAVLAANLRRTLVDGDGIAKRLSTLAVDAETLGTSPLHLQPNEATAPAPTCFSGRRRPEARSRATAVTSKGRRRRPLLRRRASRPWRRARERQRSQWSSAFCLTTTASCSRSVISSPRARSTRAVTISSPLRRGWRASWRSPRATFRPDTGSTLAVLSLPSRAARRSSPGRGRCSNI